MSSASYTLVTADSVYLYVRKYFSNSSLETDPLPSKSRRRNAVSASARIASSSWHGNSVAILTGEPARTGEPVRPTAVKRSEATTGRASNSESSILRPAQPQLSGSEPGPSRPEERFREKGQASGHHVRGTVARARGEVGPTRGIT
eukprot:33187-Prymnesium_polylepis.1